jgi:ribosome modulation factor
MTTEQCIITSNIHPSISGINCKIIPIMSEEGQRSLSSILGFDDSRIEACMASFENSWKFGNKAYSMGLSEDKNPYPEGSKKHYSWVKGWNDGYNDVNETW